ncbi:hypothetical protein B566_EDAN014817 [Ephemera danica]|nr:hypothetical protein B566_EDAN014817 [Ephemera danica]
MISNENKNLTNFHRKRKMASSTSDNETMYGYRVCETPGCGGSAKLQCPTCVKLGIVGSYFCSQDCFTSSWQQHRVLHKVAQGKDKEEKVSSSGAIEPWPFFKFTGQIRPYRQGVRRTVPGHIPRPDYADHIKGFSLSEQKLRNSSLGREVLDEAAKIVGVGVTTDELDRVIHEACIERECYPSPLNYYMFPRSCCTSVNEVICHGIPDMRLLADGDICNVDVTVFHRGFHGDLNETFFIGDVSPVARKLVNVTWECLSKAMEIVKPGEKYREIGNVIQKHAQANGFSVVRSYCGHGIHIGVMKAGHCFTIEPMISQGTWRDEIWPDNWTAVTSDGMLSAQFEHTLLVTDSGVEVLTQRPEKTLPHFLDSQ